MPLLRERLRPKVQERSGLKNVVIEDIYGEFTGTHKDYKSFLMLSGAKDKGMGTIVLLTSGTQGLSINEIARDSTYKPKEIIHIIPEDSPASLKKELEKEEFSRVLRWRRDKFLDRKRVAELIGKDDFYFAEEDFDSPRFTELLVDMGMLSDISSSKYVGMPVGTGDLAIAITQPMIDTFDYGINAVYIVPKGQHPLSKSFKKFRRDSSAADKLSTNFFSPHYREIIEGVLEKGVGVVVEVDNKDIRKASKCAALQGIDAEPSGLVSLTLLDREFRARNALDFRADDRITLYITGRYGRECETIPRVAYGCVFYNEVRRLRQKTLKGSGRIISHGN